MSDSPLIATRNEHAKTQYISGSHTSHTWAPTNKSCTTKPQNEKWEEAIFLQILELTYCSHFGLFVDSHPKFTCQTQSISVSHTWGTRKGHGVMYACECRQKGHFFFNFLTHCSVESTNTAHTKIQSESKSQYQENEYQHFAALSTDKQELARKDYKQ